MEDREIAAITVAALGPDENGLNRYLWATKKQAERLLELQFDETRNRYVYKIGNMAIRPCDILSMKFVRVKDVRSWVSFERYVIDQLEKEDTIETQKLGEINKEGVERLAKIRSKLLN